MATTSPVDLMVQSFLTSDCSNGVDVAICFDTTGSMYGALQEVRTKVNETVTSLLRDITNIRFAIMAHGDYCDGSALLKTLDFSKSPKEITDFVNTAPPTGGGDWPEAYEYVLRESRKLSWKPEHAKALIMIGDAPPHPPSYTSDLIWWRDEVEALYRFMGVRIYAVQAYESRSSEPFWREIARRSGGVYLRLSNFNLMTDMFRAVCYHQAGSEHFETFQQSIDKSSKSLNEMIKAIKSQDNAAPAPLGDYDMEWWSLRLDTGHTEFKRSYYPGRYDRVDKGFVTTRLYKSSWSWNQSSIIDAAVPKESLRTGTSLLEPHKPKVKLLKEDAHLGPSPTAPKRKTDAEKAEDKMVLRKVRDGVFELVDPTSLSKEELETADRDRKEAKEIEEDKKRKASLEKELEQPGKPIETVPEEVPLLASAETLRNAAVKRIMKDLVEIKSHPIHNISAEPNGEDNLFEWHGNMAGPSGTPYEGTVFHFVLKFPDTYPNSPPTLVLGSDLFHPNVFGRWICLDILELGSFSSDKDKAALFTGWSTGYSASTVLIQLQAFLFEGAIKEPKLAEESCKRAQNFVCSGCGHQSIGAGCIPPLPVIEDPAGRPRPDTKNQIKKKSGPKARVDYKPVEVPRVETKAETQAKAEEASVPVNKSELSLGMCVLGTVVRVRNDLGAFLQITSGDKTVGLVHRTNIVGSSVSHLKAGEQMKVWVIDVEGDKVALSLIADPLERAYRVQNKIDFGALKVGDARIGKVVDQATGGFLVDLDVYTKDTVGRNKRITGYLHITESSADTEVGRSIKVLVEEIDLELGRIRLTCREEGEECSTIADKLADSIVLNKEEGVKKSKVKEGINDMESALNDSILGIAPMEVLFAIMEHLNPIDLIHLGETCRFFAKVIEDGHSYLWERKEMVCFHSKVPFVDQVLGVGLNLEIKQFNNQLAYITSTFDLLSHFSFEAEGVRRASWKEPFTHWIPLCINGSHFRKALPLIQSSISNICTGKTNQFSPFQILEVLPKLMNSFVVQAMSGRLTASIMALEGYSAFHHLFITLLEEYPQVWDKVEDTIELFLKDEVSRHKTSIPTLGEWIVLLSVSRKYTWKDVAVSYLMENFDRNVLWTLKAYPHLHTPSKPDETENRLNLTWTATQVSNRLLMFHVYFLRNVARPPGISLEQTRQLLDSRYGRPTFAMKEKLLREVKAIHQVGGWDHFFQKIGLYPPSHQLLVFWLHDSLFRSSRRRYHRRDQFTPEYLAAIARAEKEASRIPAQETTKAAAKSKRATVGRDDEDSYYDKLHSGRPEGWY